jgi:hypothetical protein
MRDMVDAEQDDEGDDVNAVPQVDDLAKVRDGSERSRTQCGGPAVCLTTRHSTRLR